MNSKPAVIITSIFEPNPVMREIAAQSVTHGMDFIIAGDSKSPADFHIEGADFLSIQTQREMGEYGRLCPERTYARKNLAYLRAITAGAPWIVETDDDNLPGKTFWSAPNRLVGGRKVEQNGWINAYRYFADTFIYPRGFPIDRALPEWNESNSESPTAEGQSTRTIETATAVCPIQQSLADENPDVDAVYRMLHPLPFNFRQDAPLILGEGAWCPFNSQNTVFFPEVYPLLYLPATCSFRMTDIWRSFIAQRVLWTCGWNLSFHSATVVQDRNEHNLLRDFEDEISGYLGNGKIIDLLGSLSLKSGQENLRANLELCYSEMIQHGFFKPVEESLLTAWLNDLKWGGCREC